MATPLYVLDTDTASAYLKGSAAVQHRLFDVGWLRVRLSRVTLAELRVAALFGGRRARITPDGVDRLGWTLGIFEATPAAWERFAALKRQVLAAGVAPGPTGNFDILQAASALENDATFVTHNTRHFAPLRELCGLRHEDWL